MSVLRKAEEGRIDWMMVKEPGTIPDSITYCVPDSQCVRGSVAVISVCSTPLWTVEITRFRDTQSEGHHIFPKEVLSHTTKKNVLNKAVLVPRNCCLRMNR